MKKLYYLIVLTLILGLVLTGCSLLSNIGQAPVTDQGGISYIVKNAVVPPIEAFKTDLLAGQTLDVGDVLVWNDEINLYVKYVIINPDWCLTETHLHVATSLEDIPQKNGNPPPGQFDYKDEHDCVTEFIYTIPLDVDWASETDLSIAAHAVVVNIEETIETEIDLEWGRSLEDPEYICSSSSTWGEAVTVACGLVLSIDTNQIVWDQTTWAYWLQYPIDENTYQFQVRHFQALFELPKEIKPDNVEDLILFSPDYLDDDIIPINDNMYVYLNNNEIGRKGTCYPPASLNWTISPDVGWYVPGSFSTEGPQNLIVGPNVIDIVAEEGWGWGGMGRLGLKLIWHPEETAWADGTDFPGANWATYFTYNLQEVLIDTVEVFSNGGVSPCSVSLEDGKEYRLEVSGTYRFANWGEAGIADAKFSLRIPGSYNPDSVPQWISGDVFPAPVTNYLELWMNGSSQDWIGGYFSHIYLMDYDGNGIPVCFSILDDHYGDNSGSLTVDIYWIP